MSVDWKKRQIERDSSIFNRLYKAWREDVEEETGKRGNADLFAFMINHPKGKKPYRKNDSEEKTLSEKCWEGDPDCWEAMRRHNEIASHKHNHNSVSSWKNGKSLISDSFKKKICQVCGVPTDYFDEDSWGILSLNHSLSARMKEYQRLKEYAEENGLSEDFVRYVTSLPDVARVFPFHDEASSSFGLNFRETFVSSETPFEITDDVGTTVFLNEADLDTLSLIQKEVSEKIKDYVRLRLSEEREKLIKESMKKEITYRLEKNRGESAGEDFEKILERVLRNKGLSDKFDISNFSLFYNTGIPFEAEFDIIKKSLDSEQKKEETDNG